MHLSINSLVEPAHQEFRLLVEEKESFAIELASPLSFFIAMRTQQNYYE